MDDHEPSRRGRAARRARGSLVVAFALLGVGLNLLGLVLLAGNLLGLARAFVTGAPIILGGEQLAPFGAFLAGLLCFALAYTLD